MRVFRTSLSYQNPLKSRFPEVFFSSVPETPGVYLMRSVSGEILYIGKAKNLRKRLMSYRIAKPGSVGENIIEMLERVRKIDFEEHPTERQAFERERELIRAIVPPFNIADAWEENYFFIGIRVGEKQSLQLRLTSRESDAAEFELLGCFARRTRIKAAYSSLLRLLFAVNSDRPRFSFPARLARSSPAYSYQFQFQDSKLWIRLIHGFFGMGNPSLLEVLVARMLENETIPEFVRPGLQEDLEILIGFHREINPVNPGLRRGFLSQSEMRDRIRSSVS